MTSSNPWKLVRRLDLGWSAARIASGYDFFGIIVDLETNNHRFDVFRSEAHADFFLRSTMGATLKLTDEQLMFQTDDGSQWLCQLLLYDPDRFMTVDVHIAAGGPDDTRMESVTD